MRLRSELRFQWRDDTVKEMCTKAENTEMRLIVTTSNNFKLFAGTLHVRRSSLHSTVIDSIIKSPGTDINIWLCSICMSMYYINRHTIYIYTDMYNYICVNRCIYSCILYTHKHMLINKGLVYLLISFWPVCNFEFGMHLVCSSS